MALHRRAFFVRSLCVDLPGLQQAVTKQFVQLLVVVCVNSRQHSVIKKEELHTLQTEL